MLRSLFGRLPPLGGQKRVAKTSCHGTHKRVTRAATKAREGRQRPFFGVLHRGSTTQACPSQRKVCLCLKWTWVFALCLKNRPPDPKPKQAPSPVPKPQPPRSETSGLKSCHMNLHVKESLSHVCQMLFLAADSMPMFENDPRLLPVCLKMTPHLCLEMTLGFQGAKMLVLRLFGDDPSPCPNYNQ